jgi:aryl-alcohol dehydrogenase-like predicted oxidoreductase
MKRRDFLKSIAYGGAGAAVGRWLPAAAAQAANAPENQPLPRRRFGRTKVKLSIVGFGGITLAGVDQDRCDKLVADAVEQGVNYFDSSPRYGDSEPRVGKALEPHRKQVFLACKTKKRSYGEAREQFEQSLKDLRTDYLDLYQLHAISDVKRDVDAAFADDGVMKLLTEARKAGKVRYLGFSAHSVQAALAAMDRFDFDSILFPINYACWMEGNFGPQVLEVARKKKMAILALKSLCHGRWTVGWRQRPQDKRGFWYEPVLEQEDARDCMAFTLSREGVVSLLPPGKPFATNMAIRLGKELKPFSPGAKRKLARMADQVKPLFSYSGDEQAMDCPGDRNAQVRRA